MIDRDLALIRIGILARSLYGDSIWGETQLIGPVPYQKYKFAVPNKGDLVAKVSFGGRTFVRMMSREVSLKKWLWSDGTSVWLGYLSEDNILVYSFDETLFPDEKRLTGDENDD